MQKPRMELQQLLQALPIRRAGTAKTGERAPHITITAVTDDSRRVTPGSVFVARRGTSTDGARYIAEAAGRGAAAVLTDAQGAGAAAPPGDGGPVVLIADDPARLGVELANRLRGWPATKLTTIAVTGTNGKTTTVHMIRHLLSAAGRRCGLIGTIEIDDGRDCRPSDLTTPGALEVIDHLARMVEHGCKACVMEASSHALDQGRVDPSLFSAAVFTNLSGDHLDYHGDMATYAAAKARLFEGLGPTSVAVINADDPSARRMSGGCRGIVRRYTLGVAAMAECRATVLETSARATRCRLDGPWGRLHVALPLVGSHNVANLAAAATTVSALGVDLLSIADAVEALPPVPGRLERVTLRGAAPPFEVLVDYAHTPDALANVLRALRPLTRGRLRVLFGCGGDRDATKRPRMAAVACELADAVTITSDNPRTEDPQQIIAQIVAGVGKADRGRVRIEADRASAIRQVIDEADAGDVVLIAGKGHEDYQIIGTEKRPFDDRAVARRVLWEMAHGAAA